MKLSNNFNLVEFSISATALSKGIDNTVPEVCIPNLFTLCTKILQPLRDHLGTPIIISSGYRSNELNTAVGGVPTSHHRTGHAADIKVTNQEKAFNFIKDNLQFTQLIWYKSRNFLHVSYEAGNLKQEIIIS